MKFRERIRHALEFIEEIGVGFYYQPAVVTIYESAHNVAKQIDKSALFVYLNEQGYKVTSHFEEFFTHAPGLSWHVMLDGFLLMKIEWTVIEDEEAH